jgi:hypothetical protein
MTKREAKRIVCKHMATIVWHHITEAEWVEEAAHDKRGMRDENERRIRSALGDLHDELLRRAG